MLGNAHHPAKLTNLHEDVVHLFRHWWDRLAMYLVHLPLGYGEKSMIHMCVLHICHANSNGGAIEAASG